MKRFIRITGLVLFLVAGFCLVQVPTILAGEQLPDVARASGAQLQKQLPVGSGVRAVHPAATVTPERPFDAGVIRNAVAFLLVFGLVGLAATLAAHKMDRRIYVAGDVEQVLGVAPLAQLPDFDEVSEGVAGELVMRLASRIDYASRQAGLRQCVFTGTGAGTGVTTVAGRVKEMLGAMGRTAVLVRPTAAQRRGDGTSQFRSEPNEQADRPAPVLADNGAAENGRGYDDLTLTDAAPLTASAETEELARHCDGAIVIVESGATTRAELRATADRLQQLNVTAVGFVLNRIGRSKADPSFRRSVKETERQLRCQDRASIQKPLWNLGFAAGSGCSVVSGFEGTWLSGNAKGAGLQGSSALRVFEGPEIHRANEIPPDRVDRRDVLGNLHILPSRRGQYRRVN
jgi:hypothetical protein